MFDIWTGTRQTPYGSIEPVLLSDGETQATDEDGNLIYDITPSYSYALSALPADIEVHSFDALDGLGLEDDSLTLTVTSKRASAFDDVDIVLLGIDGALVGVYDIQSVDREHAPLITLHCKIDLYIETSNLNFTTAFKNYLSSAVGSSIVKEVAPFSYWAARSEDYGTDLETIGDAIAVSATTLDEVRSKLEESGFIIVPALGSYTISTDSGTTILTLTRVPVISAKYPVILNRIVRTYTKSPDGMLASISEKDRLSELRQGVTDIVAIQDLPSFSDGWTYSVPDAFNYPSDYSDRQIAVGARTGTELRVNLVRVPFPATNASSSTWKLPPLYLDTGVLGTVAAVSQLDLARWDLQNSSVQMSASFAKGTYFQTFPNEVVRLHSSVSTPYADQWRVLSTAVSYDSSANGVLQSLELALWQGFYDFEQKNHYDPVFPDPPDAAPVQVFTIVVYPTSMVEGGSFVVSLEASDKVEQDFSFAWSIQTDDDSITVSDYFDTTSGTFTIPAGQSRPSASTHINVTDDSLSPSQEELFFTITIDEAASTPTEFPIADALFSILNDETIPTDPPETWRIVAFPERLTMGGGDPSQVGNPLGERFFVQVVPSTRADKNYTWTVTLNTHPNAGTANNYFNPITADVVIPPGWGTSSYATFTLTAEYVSLPVYTLTDGIIPVYINATSSDTTITPAQTRITLFGHPRDTGVH